MLPYEEEYEKARLILHSKIMSHEKEGHGKIESFLIKGFYYGLTAMLTAIPLLVLGLAAGFCAWILWATWPDWNWWLFTH